MHFVGRPEALSGTSPTGREPASLSDGTKFAAGGSGFEVFDRPTSQGESA